MRKLEEMFTKSNVLSEKPLSKNAGEWRVQYTGLTCDNQIDDFLRQME